MSWPDYVLFALVLLAVIRRAELRDRDENGHAEARYTRRRRRR